jgi:hypothetical protein
LTDEVREMTVSARTRERSAILLHQPVGEARVLGVGLRLANGSTDILRPAPLDRPPHDPGTVGEGGKRHRVVIWRDSTASASGPVKGGCPRQLVEQAGEVVLVGGRPPPFASGLLGS